MNPIGIHIVFNLILLSILFVLSLCESTIIMLKSDYIDSEINEGNYSFVIIKKILKKSELFKDTVNFSRILLLTISCIVFFNSFLTNSFINNSALNTTTISFIYLCYFILSIIIIFYLPKHASIKYSTQLIKYLFLFINVFYIILYPIACVVNKITMLLNTVFHTSISQNESYTEEEIRMMMDISAEKGTIQNEEKQMIDNIFEFNNITAEDIMTHRTDVIAIEINCSNEEIIEIIKSSGLSRFPIYENEIDNIVGILSSRKFLLNLHSYPQKPIRDILYKPFIVPLTIQADMLFKKMQKTKNHIALIVDEYGGFNGLVTLEDLLEEIVGNIYDENDLYIESDIIRLNKNLWKVIGSVELETINENLSVNIPLSEDYDTLNGLVIDTLAYIPEDNTKFEVDIYGIHIQVISFIDKRIVNALISKIQN